MNQDKNEWDVCGRAAVGSSRGDECVCHCVSADEALGGWSLSVPGERVFCVTVCTVHQKLKTCLH